ncbi:MAG: hypothetical protein NUW12_07590, partial [Firmicutes bacterium]|nr:hypothetical protein [Bacillota bacterium]
RSPIPKTPSVCPVTVEPGYSREHASGAFRSRGFQNDRRVRITAEHGGPSQNIGRQPAVFAGDLVSQRQRTMGWPRL